MHNGRAALRVGQWLGLTASGAMQILPPVKGRRMIDDTTAQETLRRILASAAFANSPRMSRFLRFVVEETVAGRGGDLKEYVVGLRVFDRPESFNPTADPTVRVEASKLRAKLARYYELEGRNDPVVVVIPKGHYAATFSLRAPVEVSPAGAVEPAAVPPPTRIQRPAVLACGLAVLVIAVAYSAYVLTVPRLVISRDGRITLAVLPFQNLTGDPEQEYLCDGLTEEMIAQMSAINPAELGIIARTSAMHYKSTTKRADEIGRELGAQFLLETSLRRIGNRLRITAQLIDARSQRHVWGEQYERHAEDLLAVQGDVAAAVTRRTAASLGLSGAEVASTPKRLPKNSLVYEHYLRGRYHWSKGSSEGLRKAQEHFQQAIVLDPSYPLAYSGLADTYALLGSYDVMPLSESHQLGRQAALKALELDGSVGEAYRSLAAITADYWQWADADRYYRRALELSPNDATTLRLYAFHLAYTGHPLDALPLAEQARSLDPVSPSARTTLGTVLYLARRFDDAVHAFDEALDLDERYAMARALLGLAYISKGMPDRAVAELQTARASSTRPDIVAFHGYVLARAGRKREAQSAIDDLHRLTSPRSPSPFLVALVYTGLEDNDRAFEWLAKAADAHAWEMPTLKASPIFDGLRADPRFPALLDQVGLLR